MSVVHPMQASQQEIDKLIEVSAQTNRRFLGRFKSDTERKEYALEIAKEKKNVLRTKTTAWSDFFSDVHEIDPIMYSQKLFKALIDQLATNNLHTSRMLLRNFEWLLPGPDTTPAQLSIYDQVFTQAMTVSNDQLQHIMRMELSTNASPGTPLGNHFYLRSFELTADQLEDLLRTITRNDASFEESDEWAKSLQLHRHDPSITFTIRYVGTVEGPKRPIDRHIEDLGVRTTGLFGEFLRSLQECHPEVVLNAQVHLLPDASLLAESFLRPDDIERMLIQLFHYRTLINRQRGGFYGSYIPSAEDAQGFRDLQTDTWSTFNQKASLLDETTRAQIAAHFKEVQMFANNNPQETGTGHHEFTDDQREMIRAAATPYSLKGYTILVFIGKDQTLEEYLSCKPFIDGGSRAGYITRNFIHRLVRFEAEAQDREWSEDSFDPKNSIWCFVDLWSWLWHLNLTQATEFLQSYMQMSKPLVGVTFGKDVNAVTRASFLHENGVPMSRFTSIVAVPSIQFYDIDYRTGKFDPNSAFLNIPNIHPGRDKHGSHNVPLHRLTDLAMQYTFVVAQVAMQVVDALPNDGTEAPNRLKLCESILDEVNTLCTTSAPHKRLSEKLEQARTDLMDFWRAELHGSKDLPRVLEADLSLLSTEDDRLMLRDPDGRAKIASLGQAAGEPGSEERNEQLKELWEKNMPDLHTVIAHDEPRREIWMEDMARVEEGQYFYLHLVHQLPEDDYSRQILGQFRPSWSEEPDRLQDPDAKQEALQAAGRYVAEKRQKDRRREFVGERKSEKYLSPGACHGRPVYINSRGIFKVRWDSYNIKSETELLSKIAIPKTTSSRYMFFTENGIDIKTAGGQVFRATLFDGKQTSATIGVQTFIHDTGVKELWIEACRAHGISTDALKDADDNAVKWDQMKGVKMLAGNAQFEKPQQNRPPSPQDANWLLNEFLNRTDHLADGGVFRTAAKDKFPDSTEDVKAFVEFIKLPEYINHPYTSDWRRHLDNEKPQIQVIGKNLPMLRYSVVVNQTKQGRDTAKGGKRNVHERYYNVGAPGSALDDPFAEGSDQSCISAESKKKKKKKEEEQEQEQRSEGDERDGRAKPSSSKQKTENSGSKRKRDDGGDDDSEDGEGEKDGGEEEDEGSVFEGFGNSENEASPEQPQQKKQKMASNTGGYKRHYTNPYQHRSPPSDVMEEDDDE